MKNVIELDNLTASQRIGRLENHIVQSFLDLALEEIEAARKLSRDGVIDSLHDFLKNLCEGLSHRELQEYRRVNTKIGADHGRVRAHQRSFSFEDIVHEYRIITKVLLSSLTDNATLNKEAEYLIHDAILTASGNAIATFNEYRDFALNDYKTRERDKLISAVERSQQEFEDFLGHCEFPTFMSVGRKHRFTFANQAFKELFGEEIEGENAHEAIYLQEFEPFIDGLDKVFKNELSFQGKNLFLKGKAYNVYFYLKKDSHNAPKGIVGMIYQAPMQAKQKDKIFIHVRH